MFDFLPGRANRWSLLSGQSSKSFSNQMWMRSDHRFPTPCLHHFTCVPFSSLKKTHFKNLNFQKSSPFQNANLYMLIKSMAWALSCSAECKSARIKISAAFSPFNPVHSASSHIVFSRSSAYLCNIHIGYSL